MFTLDFESRGSEELHEQLTLFREKGGFHDREKMSGNS